MSKYEAHITFDGSSEEALRDALKYFKDTNWTFSKIDGDPTFGAGVKCYLTGHGDDYEGLLEDLWWTAGFCEGVDAEPLRIKIEKVVYDVRLDD